MGSLGGPGLKSPLKGSSEDPLKGLQDAEAQSSLRGHLWGSMLDCQPVSSRTRVYERLLYWLLVRRPVDSEQSLEPESLGVFVAQGFGAQAAQGFLVTSVEVGGPTSQVSESGTPRAPYVDVPRLGGGPSVDVGSHVQLK